MYLGVTEKDCETLVETERGWGRLRETWGDGERLTETEILVRDWKRMGETRIDLEILSIS